MSCPICRGEWPLYVFDQTDLEDGIQFETRIVHGNLLGTRVGTLDRHLGGASTAIYYCPQCGEPLKMSV